ncbi:hypothetical protein B0H13DRAFT_1889563 [Mycena leptocephala]|nr:hypothetical protein B0H13DRAFT_1889563 [Mycena leptocephala]
MKEKDSAEKGKKSDLIPPPPSRTPAARHLAMAKYRERYRAMMKANPEAYSEQQKQAKKARAKYEERCVIHLNPVFVSHSPQGIGMLPVQCDIVRENFSGGSGGTSLVFGFIKLMSSPTSSSQYYCLPPFHDEPQGRQEVIRQTVSCYLVTSPAAEEARGVYAEWTNAQRVSEAISRGGAPKYSCYNDTIPAWHACCDAGEHAHAKKPSAPAPIAPIVPTALGPMTPSRTGAVPRPPAPSSPLRTQTASLGGGGAVRTSLSEALQDLEAAVATGPARLITTQDTHYAAHIAAGHTEGQA